MTESQNLYRFAAAACVVYTLAFAAIAYEHVRYPGYTEAMEGDVLQHVERAAAGKPIYVPASEEYTPLAYFPGYYYLAAPFYWFFNDDLCGPRLTSCLCSFVAALAMGGIVYQESRSAAAGLMAIALFFAGYRIKDENLTTALPDAALLMWLALGWSMLFGERTWKRDLAAIVFFFAAFWTKQQGSILAGWGLLYLGFEAWTDKPSRRAGWLAAVVIVLFGGSTAMFLAGLHPFGDRMYHFTVELPSQWERSPFHSIQRFVLVSFLFVPFAWLATAVLAFRDGFAISRLRQPLLYLIASTTVTCLYTVAATGSSNNHYIPLIALLEAATVLGAWRIASDGPPRWLLLITALTALMGCFVAAAAWWKNEGHPLPLFVAPVLVIVAALGRVFERRLKQPRAWAVLLLGGQFAASFYSPWDYLPASGWRSTLEEFRTEILRLAPDVELPDYGAVPLAFAGTSVDRFPSWVVLEDVTRTRNPNTSDISPYRERMDKRPPRWLVTCIPLDSIPVWQEYSKVYTRETDYGSRFADLHQLCRHWYGDRIYPRYLYRRPDNP